MGELNYRDMFMAEQRLRMRIQDEVRHLEYEIHKLRNVINSIEWGANGGYECPNCQQDEKDGHHPDCSVGKALSLS